MVVIGFFYGKVGGHKPVGGCACGCHCVTVGVTVWLWVAHTGLWLASPVGALPH